MDRAYGKALGTGSTEVRNPNRPNDDMASSRLRVRPRVEAHRLTTPAGRLYEELKESAL
jgi:hypothetical protein